MKPIDNALYRLLKAAAAGSRPFEENVPYRVESRVLAACRSGLGVADDVLGLISLFRRGVVLASLVALIALAICRHGLTSETFTVESMVFDSVAEMSLLP